MFSLNFIRFELGCPDLPMESNFVPRVGDRIISEKLIVGYRTAWKVVGVEINYDSGLINIDIKDFSNG